MEKIFVYGDLINKEIQDKIKPVGEGSLKGWKKDSLHFKGETYPVLVKSRNPIDFVFGKVFEISEEDLKRLDELGEDYFKRREVVLSSGEDVWIYVK